MKQTVRIMMLCAALVLSGGAAKAGICENPAAPADDPAQELRQQYAELYDALHVFTDLNLPEKAWLVGEENIVQLISISDINDVLVMPRRSIERIKQIALGEITTIMVYDKTGEMIFLMTVPEKAPAVLEALK